MRLDFHMTCGGCGQDCDIYHLKADCFTCPACGRREERRPSRDKAGKLVVDVYVTPKGGLTYKWLNKWERLAAAAQAERRAA